MGGGGYSISNRSIRSESLGFSTKSVTEIFKERSMNNAMDPYGVTLRESRDSNEHPNSLAVIIALDLTGSMGSVPKHLVSDGLPHIMDTIIKGGEKDPQVLFLGVGDHECDEAPLQVGQFESSDELLDHWLTTVYLEGGGGGNAGESYLLAWYFAGLHTSIDCMEKRGRKGFLFTIGDEPTLKHLPKNALKHLMGDGQHEDYTADVLLAKASEKYNVYHIHISETGAGSRQSTVNGWKQLLQDNCIVAERHSDVSKIISDIILNYTIKGAGQITSKVSANEATPEKKDESEPEIYL
jgi:hypothetical protein